MEDIQDLHRQGWLLANLDKRRGGLGFGLNGDDPLSFFLIDEHLAYGNPSTAHCFQVHNNGLMMIDAMASDAQVKKWLAPTIERGALIPVLVPSRTAWRRPARKKRAGGYLVSGTKHYATNASMAEWLWIGRVVSDSHAKPIMFMLHKDTPGLENRHRGLAPHSECAPASVHGCTWKNRFFAVRRKLVGATRAISRLKTGWAKSTSPLPRTIWAQRAPCTTGRSPIFAKSNGARTATGNYASASSKACSTLRG